MTMKKITLLAGMFASCALAQPPAIIRIIRNSVVQPYMDAKSAVNVIGMSSISGFSETWLVELHDSFGSLEDLDQALAVTGSYYIPVQPPITTGDDVLPPSKTLVGIYRPALSYRPDQAIQSFPKARYFDVIFYHIRPGTEAAFANFLKLRGFSLDSINLDRPEIVYQVISGGKTGTYVVLTPLPSLKVLDDGRANTPVYAEGEQAAAKQILADTELVREHLWFRTNPLMSYVSDEFASADINFWRPNGR
jgi:hypothetical protein